MKKWWVVTLLGLCLGASACGSDEDAHHVRTQDLTADEEAFARVGRLTADDASDGNQFAAALDADGRVVAVGAPQRKPGGAVYLFNLSGTQRRVIEGADGIGLGTHLAYQDGTLAALAPDDGPGGTLHVYRPTESGGMHRVAGLAPADVVGGDKFGAAIDIADTTLVVGAPGRGDGGEVWVYETETPTRNQWRPVAVLDSEDVGFGRTVALDADRLAVGARDDSNGAGTVTVFERNADGDWGASSRLTAPDESQRDEFGAAIDLDGRLLVAGAAESGALHLFEFDGEQWEPAATIVPPRATEGFGSSVALDDGRLVAGTFLSDERVWIYRRGSNGWEFASVFGALEEDPRPNYLGTHVAIVGDSVVVGGSDPPVMRNGDITGYRQGWVDVFRLNAAPIAEDASATGPEDRLFSLGLEVSEPDGETITSEVVRPPSHGTIEGEGTHLNYRSDMDYYGADDARIAFVDPYGARTEIEVDIEVTPVNDAPRGKKLSIQVHPGEPTPVALEAYDPEDDPIRVLIAGKPANGVIDGQRSPLTYTSDPTYQGFDFVEFRLTDGIDRSIVYELEIEVVAPRDPDLDSEEGPADPAGSTPSGVASSDGCATTGPPTPAGACPALLLLFLGALRLRTPSSSSRRRK